MATPTQKRLNRTVEEINPLLDKLDEGYTKSEIDTLLEDKVDKETGKGLSTNDYTTAEKTKLDNLAEIKTVGTGLNLDDNGELTATGGGSGGTTNYNDLSNKPQINGNTLSGNKTSAQLGLASASDIPTTLADLSDDSTHRTVSDTEKATWNAKADASDIPTVPITAIQKNGTGITPISGTVNITVPTTAADVSALPDTTKYAAALSLTINSSTFVITGQLKDQNGDNLGTAQTIDLPLESVVVGGSYNSQTKKVVLTLQNGNTIEFSVADLVSGLQTEFSASNKLNPAYINYDSAHRAVSDTEKSTWNSKQNALSSTQLDAVNSGIDSTKVEQIETNKNNILWNTNQGVKNLLQNTASSSGIFTVNSDGSVKAYAATVTGSPQYLRIKDNLNLPAGNYILSGATGGSTTTYSMVIQKNVSTSPITIARCTSGDTSFTLDGTESDIGVTISVPQNNTINTTFYPMIRKFGDSSYQPYALSNAELTAKEQVNENNISSIGAIIGKQVYSAFFASGSGTAEYQMNTADFQTDTPNTQQCGIYIVYVISWSTTPVVSIYTVGYSGGTTGYNVVTKIVGTDSLISVDENRKITYTGKGKISIYAMR